MQTQRRKAGTISNHKFCQLKRISFGDDEIAHGSIRYRPGRMLQSFPKPSVRNTYHLDQLPLLVLGSLKIWPTSKIIFKCNQYHNHLSFIKQVPGKDILIVQGDRNAKNRQRCISHMERNVSKI